MSHTSREGATEQSASANDATTNDYDEGAVATVAVRQPLNVSEALFKTRPMDLLCNRCGISAQSAQVKERQGHLQCRQIISKKVDEYTSLNDVEEKEAIISEVFNWF
jgi:late competence protein required for DNA uptake (superfamily II DNA/RNA helicase)